MIRLFALNKENTLASSVRAVELNFVAADAAYTQYGVGVSARVNNRAFSFVFVYYWKRRRSIKLPAQAHTHTHTSYTHSSAQHPLDFLAIFPIDAIFIFISAAAKALKFNLAGKLIIIASARTMWVQFAVSMRRCWPRGRLQSSLPAPAPLGDVSATGRRRLNCFCVRAFGADLCFSISDL